ncbi:SDR family oxidoreductase [Herbiconiux sp. CPCC 203407]|uniref:SDR family oxidoreductase n=1 Tax=Herbiconiux oxytropis TaxID=2970915 RepID=A0AA42BVB5_9MICO|nr:SDR family oxidoreductase [Herbiconiux oxytropis]MCS5721287.1 SDR family oxidoreductase [Herbiconiux oxytropis]MCS5726274.1 SDR family oxidoreductase [Herbiconiux oxytropis]
MTIVVTGATGHLGRLAIDHLLARGVPADGIVGAGRDPQKLAALADATGVGTAVIDYSDPASLDAALAGASTLVLVSGSEVGKRVEQHGNAIEAAKRAGVERLVYTSAPKATTSALVLAPEHKATEELIAASGLAATILRNNWYNENYANAFAQAGATGVHLASIGQGTVASASRSDYAEAIAAVVTADDPQAHAGAVYELSGDTAWTGEEFAAAAARVLGREVVFSDSTPEEHLAALTAAGLDEGTAGFVVTLDGNIRDGLLGETSGDLGRLIGRPTVTLEEYFRSV